jgi:hypothetical protein
MVVRLLRELTELGAGVVDLVLPTACAGCGAERVTLRYGVCAPCVAVLEGLRPHATAPEPPPPGLPPVTAVGSYATVLRGTLLAYKEKGRHRLARPLGALLAGAVAQAAVAGGGSRGGPLLVVPVPSTAAITWRVSPHTPCDDCEPPVGTLTWSSHCEHRPGSTLRHWIRSAGPQPLRIRCESGQGGSAR